MKNGCDKVTKLAILEAYENGEGCVSIAMKLKVPYYWVHRIVSKENPGAQPRP